MHFPKAVPPSAPARAVRLAPGEFVGGTIDLTARLDKPGRRRLDTAHRIQQLAAEIGVKTVYLVTNKVHDESELEFVRSSADGLNFIGHLPFDEAAGDADRRVAELVHKNRAAKQHDHEEGRPDVGG